MEEREGKRGEKRERDGRERERERGRGRNINKMISCDVDEK